MIHSCLTVSHVFIGFSVYYIYTVYILCVLHMFSNVSHVRLSIPGSDCSRNFTSPLGLIESPGFPDKYPHNLECSFIIIVPPSMDVTLSFLTFDLENDPLPGGEGECKYDWLEVWDGLPGGETLMMTDRYPRGPRRNCRLGYKIFSH